MARQAGAEVTKLRDVAVHSFRDDAKNIETREIELKFDATQAGDRLYDALILRVGMDTREIARLLLQWSYRIDPQVPKALLKPEVFGAWANV